MNAIGNMCLKFTQGQYNRKHPLVRDSLFMSRSLSLTLFFSFCLCSSKSQAVVTSPLTWIIKICHYKAIGAGEICAPSGNAERIERIRKSHMSCTVKLLPRWEADIMRWVVWTWIWIVKLFVLVLLHTRSKCMNSTRICRQAKIFMCKCACML